MITKEVSFIYETNGKRSVRWAQLEELELSSNDTDPMLQLTTLAWDYKKLEYRRFAIHKMLELKPLTPKVIQESAKPIGEAPQYKDIVMIWHRNLGSKDEYLFRTTSKDEYVEPVGWYSLLGWIDCND